MSKGNIIGMGIIVILIIGGVLFWWFTTSSPTEEEISSVTPQVPSVQSDILTSKTTKEIQAKKTFGNIPIQISSDYQHKDLFKK